MRGLPSAGQLLAREKELTRLGDQIARERRALPWVRVDKTYSFDAPHGRRYARGPVRRAPPASGAALHVRAGLGAGLPELLLHGRPHRRHDRASGASRRHAGRRLARAAGRDRAVPQPHGLDVPAGCRRTAATSTTTSRELHARRDRQGRADYNYGGWPFADEEWPGVSVFYKDDAGRSLPHLLDLWARRRGHDGHLQPARPHAQGPRRGRDSFTMDWVRHHDRYEPAPKATVAGSCCADELSCAWLNRASAPAASRLAVAGGRANLRRHGAGHRGRRGGPLDMLCAAGASPLAA